MISEFRISVLLRGESFSPLEAEEITGLSLADKIEVGEISKRGKYRGKPSPYGSAQLKPPVNIEDDEKVSWLLSELESHLDRFYKLGAEKTRIHAGYFYVDQCNFGLTSNQIKRIASLGLDFDVSCYEVSDEQVH